jgi:hypothetical protein
MARRSFIYVLFFCLLTCCTWALTQYRSTPTDKDKKDNCSEYKMRVVTPSNEIDYILQKTEPREDIDFKGKVVDPCKQPDAKSSKTPPLPGQEKQK